MRNIAFVAVVALLTVLFIGVFFAIRTPQEETVLASPTASAARSLTPTSTTSPSVRPTPPQSPSPSGPATSAEQVADRLPDALEASDFERVRPLIDPAGVFY